MSSIGWSGSWTLIAGVAIIVVLALAEVIVISRRRNSTSLDFSLQRRSKILTASEKNFFECLLNALSDDFYVFTKVAMLDVVEASPRAGYFEKQRILKRLRSQCFEYVLCKKNDLSIFGIVELENFEKRSDQTSKAAREALIATVCKTAHLHVFYFDIKQDYRDVDIRRLVTGRSSKKGTQQSHVTGRPTHLTVDNSAYEIYAKSRTCPQCNGELVTKVAVKGKNIGKKYLLCRKYPYCDYRTHVDDESIQKLQEQQAVAQPVESSYKDWSPS